MSECPLVSGTHSQGQNMSEDLEKALFLISQVLDFTIAREHQKMSEARDIGLTIFIV